MLKKVMLYLMMLVTAYKGIALAWICLTDFERLPAAVYVSTGLVVALGLVLTVKFLVGSIHSRNLELYYCIGALSVVLNLIFMKLFTRVEVTLLDFLVIGTLMDVVVGVTLVAMAARESRYILVRMKSEA